jgi:hypothetical protein
LKVSPEMDRKVASALAASSTSFLAASVLRSSPIANCSSSRAVKPEA